jgi:hypothetical protein
LRVFCEARRRLRRIEQYNIAHDELRDVVILRQH